jgi:hypothetical protein
LFVSISKIQSALHARAVMGYGIFDTHIVQFELEGGPMPSQAENQNESLTFEKFWAALQESARKFDLELKKSREEADRKYEKMREEREEATRKSELEFERMRKEREEEDRKYKESREEAALEMKELKEAMKETDRRMKETDRQMKETDRQMKETDKKIGELGNRFGELAEHLVAPSIMRKFNDLGFQFNDRSENHEINEDGNPNLSTELDILLENGEIAIAVEVKAKPKQKDVDEHIRRMEILRRKADRHNDTRKFRGAIAGAIMKAAVRDYVIKNGFYAIEQSGDTVLINIPEGFEPREW